MLFLSYEQKQAARVALVFGIALGLAACVTTRQSGEIPGDAASQAAQAADDAGRQALREKTVRQQTHWSLAGRVAISNGRKGGSGRIDWQQQGDAYTVSLSAPVTRQSWRLSGGPQGARLEGIEGGPREGADAAQLLREATGWEIPVAALGDWVRGVSAQNLPPAAMQFDEAGRLSHLEQGGWAIDYRWPETASITPVLPQRVDAVKGEAKVKLIVDEWNIEPVVVLLDASPEAALKRVVSGLNLANPRADLLANVARGEFRPVGVCDYSCHAPGFPQERLVGRQAEINVLDSTGDVVMGEMHLGLKRLVAAYARTYNEELRVWLKQHPPVQIRTGAG